MEFPAHYVSLVLALWTLFRRNVVRSSLARARSPSAEIEKIYKTFPRARFDSAVFLFARASPGSETAQYEERKRIESPRCTRVCRTRVLQVVGVVVVVVEVTFGC